MLKYQEKQPVIFVIYEDSLTLKQIMYCYVTMSQLDLLLHVYDELLAYDLPWLFG